MAIEYQCPVCSATTTLPDEAEGTLSSCSHCRLKFIAPPPGAHVANAAEEAPTASVDPFQGAVPGFEESGIFSKQTRESESRGHGTGRRRSFMDDFDDDDSQETEPVDETEESIDALPASFRAQNQPEDHPESLLTPLFPTPEPENQGRSMFTVDATPSQEMEANLLDSTFEHQAVNPFSSPPPEPRPTQTGSQRTTRFDRDLLSNPASETAPQEPNPFAAPVPEPTFPADPRTTQRLSKPSTQRSLRGEAPPPRQETPRRPTPKVSPPTQPRPSQRATFATSSSGRAQRPPAPPPPQRPVQAQPQSQPNFVQPMAPQQVIFELQIVGGPVGMQRFNFLPGGSYVIGRDPAVSIHIASKSVSRRHALVDTAGATPVITDLGSANGMVVNGAKVSRAPLREGDIVKLGEIILRFQTLTA